VHIPSSPAAASLALCEYLWTENQTVAASGGFRNHVRGIVVKPALDLFILVCTAFQDTHGQATSRLCAPSGGSQAIGRSHRIRQPKITLLQPLSLSTKSTTEPTLIAGHSCMLSMDKLTPRRCVHHLRHPGVSFLGLGWIDEGINFTYISKATDTVDRLICIRILMDYWSPSF
jgi:hypothetical protein